MSKFNREQQELLARHRRRLAREWLTSLEPLAASPHDLGASDLIMPGSAALAISHSAGLAAEAVTVSLGTGQTATPGVALAADEVKELALFARDGSKVSVSGTPSGTLSLWAVNPFDHTKTSLVAQEVVP